MKRATIRAYGPLNDFLPSGRRQADVTVAFAGRTSVKDLLEGIGVPHPEIDLVLRNREPVAFDCAVDDGDRIAAFPRFHAVDIAGVTRVRPRPLASVRFVLDGHLGKLARRLRLVGRDAICPAGAVDAELANLADREGRILLTRDRALLKRRVVTHGAFIRETDAHQQLVEVIQRFGPFEIAPFSRCLRCNTELREVPKSLVELSVPPRTRLQHDRFQRCLGCGRIYWQGSHWKRLACAIDAALGDASDDVSVSTSSVNSRDSSAESELDQ
ncbi:MAG: twitching motility protein PilT [Acidobacteria bacterium]|nr:MAG: twitching motility protein PilT [Acidobacteriota bacterium]